jgi:hypothetical protein
MSKYEKLVFPFPQEINEIVAEGDDPDYVVKPQAYFRGACQIPGSEFNSSFQIFVKPFFLDRVQHYHEHDEYLIFLGASFPNVVEWDADVEFTVGKLGEDAETFQITQPTIVRIPAGIWHCPLQFKRIDKPILFMAALMEGVFGGIYDTPEGPKEMRYNGPIPCKYDEAKRCDVCGKCLEEDWRQ